jgi:hypothetical protein
MERVVFGRYQEQLEDYLAHVADWGTEWVEATEHSDTFLTLDAAGLRALGRELDAVVERFRENPPAPTGPTETVTVIVHAFPRRTRK